jgi:hypothetical protein
MGAIAGRRWWRRWDALLRHGRLPYMDQSYAARRERGDQTLEVGDGGVTARVVDGHPAPQSVQECLRPFPRGLLQVARPHR